jgi:GNAT superfamily N-acetyltransferase
MPIVRRAHPDDALAIGALARDVQRLHVAARPDIFVPDGGVGEPDLRARIASPDHFVWIAHEGERAVGYAFARLLVDPPSPLKRPARVLSLEELGVARDAQGAGLGRALVAEVRATQRHGDPLLRAPRLRDVPAADGARARPGARRPR